MKSLDTLRRIAGRDKRYAKLLPPGIEPIEPTGPPSVIRGIPSRNSLPVAPCTHEGNILELCGKCKGGSKDVRECDLHGKCTRAYVSDKVKSCDRCPDNDAPRPVKKPSTLQVPEPPPLKITPANSRAVVTVGAGKLGSDLLSISRPFLDAYARRLGVDYVELDWPGEPRWGISSKFALARVLDHYDRIVFLDADTLPPNTAPDLFVMCEPDEFGAYDDLPEALKMNAGLIDEYQRIREGQGLPRALVPFHLNTGVMVLSKIHRAAFSVPPRPIKPLHCAEQHWVNARLFDLKVKVKRLPQVCNWQWWSEAGLGAAPPDAIMHLSGMPKKYNRITEMGKWAALVRQRERPALNGSGGD